MSKSPAFWEPYCHRSEAEFHLSNFAARVLGRHAGVVFFDGIDAARLKQAIPDAHGDTLDLVAAVVRPPLMPIEPAETLGALTLEQLSRERGQRIAARAPSARPSLPAQGAAHARRFIEAHKTAFDAAVGGETFGVLAGAVSVAAIVGGSIALAPVLGAAADAASLLLLAEDGSMLRYELKGDEVRKKKRETSWHCKLTETVGPLLVLADLAASGMRTLASPPKVAREAGEAAEEAAQAAKRLATPRHTSDAFKRASLDNPDRAARQTVMHAMQTETSSLAAGVRRAQQKMLAARRELLLLRTIEAPAHLASIYGAGVYGMDPPEAVSRSTDWLRQQKDEPPPVHPDHPAHLLIPQRPAVDGSSGAPAMQLHVAVGHRPRAAPAAPSAA
ncbi:hypothetical protein [Burkholderia thailandensis]|uniref:hypothetical protein n=1 Tax=Burkholderia thailandensis TaxID=57975 RepID=UPI0003EC9E7C|nr:hypothetical protein [Burkholderia thailandensis]AHI67213.1 hypothetical protein BTL_4207 [Burkholderia thailandensis H0587]AOJ53985.1 hypothetical protein AQ475_24625 [Burkholderia thailandensis]AVR27872.1 hypothetical protein A8H32_23115 [Burkholderia thailandensis]MCZ2895507.1 hypothetical protein [Burkholderia thailandensis]